MTRPPRVDVVREHDVRATRMGRDVVLPPAPVPPRVVAPPPVTAAVTLTLPWEFLVPDNAKYGVLGGHLLLTARYRTAKQALHLAALAAWRTAGRREPLAGPVAIEVVLCAPDKRVRDVSNYAKILGDALTGAVLHDDGQIDVATFRRGPTDKANPRAVLTVSPLTPEP